MNINWTITRPMMEREGYLEEYVAFWNARPEVNKIWASLYTPQLGEQTPEMLTPEQRRQVSRALPELAKRYPKLLMPEGVGHAFVKSDTFQNGGAAQKAWGQVLAFLKGALS